MKVDFKEIAIDFANALADSVKYNVYNDSYECIHCLSDYVDGNVIHEEDCISKKAVEFLNEFQMNSFKMPEDSPIYIDVDNGKLCVGSHDTEVELDKSTVIALIGFLSDNFAENNEE